MKGLLSKGTVLLHRWGAKLEYLTIIPRAAVGCEIGVIFSLISNKSEWNSCLLNFSLNSECLDTSKLKSISFQCANT